MTDRDPGAADAVLARLAEADYQAWVRGFADSPGVTVVDPGDVLYRTADVRHEYLNGVFGTWLEPAVAEQRIRDVIAAVGRRGEPFLWTVWPSDRPLDLTARLVAAGLDDLGTDPLMAMDVSDAPLDEPAPPELDVRPATTAADIAAVAAFALGSLGDPVDDGVAVFGGTLRRIAMADDRSLRLFGGWIDGELVSSSGLSTRSGVAGIYAVATSAEHRGKGYGRALTLAAMRAGAALGLTTTVLMASELGQPVYRRLGYREVGRVRFLRWSGEERSTVP